MNIKRLYVHENIYPKFLTQLVQVVKNLKVDSAEDTEALLGPVQNSLQFEKVQDLYSEIPKQSWKVTFGGVPDSTSKGKGYFLPPTTIDNPPDDSRIVVDEPFGPIFPAIK